MSDDLKLRLLHQIMRIRAVEEAIADRYSEGKMRCPTHLSIGQEGVAAAVGMSLERSDLAVSGHRAHAHYLGKGGDLDAMIAEIHGKQTGCSGGKGGSMHLVDEAAGFAGSTAIVGGTVPVGVGLAYAAKVRETGQVVCIFLGDAVVEEGVFFESVNFAVLKQLPVVFVCENNLYSVYSPLSVRQPEGRRIHEMVGAMGLPSAHADGNDALLVHRIMTEGVTQVRAGGGPRFYEFDTYRWREHCGPFYDNDIGYRSVEEFEQWKARDPLEGLRRAILAEDPANTDRKTDRIAEIEAAIAEEVAAAFEFAERSAFPPAEAAWSHEFFEGSG